MGRITLSRCGRQVGLLAGASVSPPPTEREPHDQAKHAADDAGLVQGGEGDEVKQAVCVRPRGEWRDVVVHDAVERHVRQRAGECADDDRRAFQWLRRCQPGQACKRQFVVPPAQPGAAQRRGGEGHDAGDDDGSRVGVGKAVQYRRAAKHAHERFDIHGHLRNAEGKDAEAVARHCLDGEPRPHVERREGHGVSGSGGVVPAVEPPRAA